MQLLVEGREDVPWAHVLLICTEVLVESCKKIDSFKVGVPVQQDYSHTPLTLHWLQALMNSVPSVASRKRRRSEPSSQSARGTSRSRLSLDALDTKTLSIAIEKESLLQSE